MPDVSARPVSLLRIVLVFVATLVAGIVAVVVLYALLESVMGWAPESSAMGLVLPVVAAMSGGQFWANREKAAPASGRLWAAALWSALATVILQAALVWLAIATDSLPGFSQAEALSADDRRILMIALAGVAVLTLLLIRSGYWWGARTAVKQAERLAAKAAAKG